MYCRIVCKLCKLRGVFIDGRVCLLVPNLTNADTVIAASHWHVSRRAIGRHAVGVRNEV